MKTVELDYDQIDTIVVDELKYAIETIMDDPWVGYHDYKESARDANAFLRVLSYYSVHEDFESYKQTLDYSKFPPEQSGSITIDEITENDDGSADFQFSASPEELKSLAEEGFKYILMKAASGKTDDEIAKIIM